MLLVIKPGFDSACIFIECDKVVFPMLIFCRKKIRVKVFMVSRLHGIPFQTPDFLISAVETQEGQNIFSLMTTTSAVPKEM